MPTYEYQCPEGHHFEKRKKMSKKPQAKCPVCGKPTTRKISGGAGLVFKGSGFYITDYGKDGKGPRKADAEKPAPESKPDAAAKADAAPTGNSDAKPAKKADAKPAKKASSE